jgi:hypothetical protein
MFCFKARCGHGCYIFQMQKTIADAVEFVGGISACSFHVFVLELMENGDVIGFFHSQYGSGTVISAFEINAKRTTGSVPLPPEYSLDKHSTRPKCDGDTLHTLKKN